MQSRFTFTLIAIGLALGTPVSLHAAVFTPNVFDDPTPVAAPNGCTGQGSNPTRCSLREAALAANASAGADTISLGAGTYQLTIPEAGTPESGDLDFSEGVPYGITLQGQGPANTKIQAAAGLNERILEVSGADVSLTLQGITFEGGNSPGNGGAFFSSTGASVDPDPYNVLNCNFIGNKAVGPGGAIYMSSSNPDIVMDGGRYDNNESTTGDGGAIYLSHGALAGTELDLVKNLVLTNNRALSGQGGAIFQSASNGPSFSNLQVQGNRARDFAGGIFTSNGGSPLGVELTDSVISNNTVTNGDGGGLIVSTGGLVKIVNTTFSGNQAQGATGEGGGAEISNGGGIQVLNSTFSGNKGAGQGGGIKYTGGGGTIVEFTNTTISGNSTTGPGGGGIFTDHNLAISFNNVTIANNTASAGVGGGAWATTTPVILRNTIFSGATGLN